jgi:hypothetical protein
VIRTPPTTTARKAAELRRLPQSGQRSPLGRPLLACPFIRPAVAAVPRFRTDDPRPTARARDLQAVRSRCVPLVSCLIVLGLVPLIASCAGDHQAEPTIGSVNFTPRLVVSVDEVGFAVAKGETDNPAITADPASAPEGTVIEIRNTGSAERRVTNEAAIDTGVMQPGDSTTVVLTTQGELELHDAASEATLMINVTPRAA